MRWKILVVVFAVLGLSPDAAGTQQLDVPCLWSLGRAGSWTRAEGQPGRYDLVLRNLGQVTSFRDQPVGRADTLSARRLVRRWRAFGFVEDMPNAALVLADAPRDNDVVILELGRPRLLRGGRAIALRARLVPQRKPAALARFVRRVDRRVAVRFGRASLFIDPSSRPSSSRRRCRSSSPD